MNCRDMMDVLLRTDNKTKLAKALGISRPTLDRYIRNPDTMPIRLVHILARVKGYRLHIDTIPHTYS